MAEQVIKWYLVIQGYVRSQPDEESALRAGLKKIELGTRLDEATAFSIARQVWDDENAQRFTAPNGQVYPRSPKIIKAFEPDWPDAPQNTTLDNAERTVGDHPQWLRGPFIIPGATSPMIVAKSDVSMRKDAEVIQWLESMRLRVATRADYDLFIAARATEESLDYLVDLSNQNEIRFYHHISGATPLSPGSAGYSYRCSFLAIPI